MSKAKALDLGYQFQNANWKHINSFPIDKGAFPNRLVMLLVEKTNNSKHCLEDAIPGDWYVTMGHYYPFSKEGDGECDPEWRYVGWDWEQDELRETTGDKVIAWQELPSKL